jgi:hypothetical protein
MDNRLEKRKGFFMLTIKGYYNGEKIMALEEIPKHIKGNVIITFVEEESELASLEDELTPSQLAEYHKSLEQLKRGEVLSHEEVMKNARARTWLIK